MKRCAIRSVIVGLAALLGLLACGPQEVRSQEAAKPAVDDFKIESRHVDIWSDGTRLSGDLWHPKDLQPGDKLPAVILCHGWGGVRSHLNQAYAPEFAKAGYVVLSFDYRGWGDSDSRMVIKEKMPEYEVFSGTHFEIYGKGRLQSIKMAIEWFDKHL
jgi:dienelactone hydrolase